MVMGASVGAELGDGLRGAVINDAEIFFFQAGEDVAVLGGGDDVEGDDGHFDGDGYAGFGSVAGGLRRDSVVGGWPAGGACGLRVTALRTDRSLGAEKVQARRVQSSLRRTHQRDDRMPQYIHAECRSVMTLVARYTPLDVVLKLRNPALRNARNRAYTCMLV